MNIDLRDKTKTAWFMDSSATSNDGFSDPENVSDDGSDISNSNSNKTISETTNSSTTDSSKSADVSTDSSTQDSSYIPPVYIMDNIRYDGYYHFKIYPPGTEVNEWFNAPKDKTVLPLEIGWGLFTDQPESEHNAWIKGVQRFQKTIRVKTTYDSIHKYINDIKLKFELDDAKFPESKSLIMPQISSVLKLLEEMKINDPSKCNDEYLANLHKLGIMELPTLKNQFKYAWLSTKFNLNNSLDKQIYSAKEVLGSYIIPVLDLGDQMCKTFFTSIDAVYEEIRRVCAEAIEIWNQVVKAFNTSIEAVQSGYNATISGIKKASKATAKGLTDAASAVAQASSYVIKKRRMLWRKFMNVCKKLCKRFGDWIINYLYIGLAAKAIGDVFKKLFTFHSKDTKSWRPFFNKLKLLLSKGFNQFNSAVIPAFKKMLKPLVVALAGYLGALSASLCADKAKKELDQKRVLEINDSSTSTLEDYNKKLKENNITNIEASKSVIIRKASNLEDGLSMSFNQEKTISEMKASLKEQPSELSKTSISPFLSLINSNNADDSSSFDTSSVNLLDSSFPCKVSMCDDYKPTDTSIIDYNKNAYLEPETYIIELDKELSYDFKKDLSNFKVGDKIGDLINCPIKAIRDSSIVEIGQNYLICDYVKADNFNDLEETDENKIGSFTTDYMNNILSSLNDTKQIDDITNNFKKQYNIENFIINYISYFRYADLASYTRKYSKSNINDLSANEFIKIYEDKADKFFKTFQNKIKKIAGKDNVYSKANSGKIITLKNEIDECKSNFINNILKLYKLNPGNIKFCSKGRIADYSLYDMYITYLNDIDYDENNPYVVKLVSLLNEFIGKRQRIEINVNNVDSLIISFNELCDKTIKKYWTIEKSSYFKELKSLYVSDKETFISTSIYDNVLNYLKKLTNCSITKEYTISIDNTGDINKILEEQSKKSEDSSYDKEQFVLLNDLKKIACRFTSILEIERSMSSYEYVNSAEIISALSIENASEYYEGKEYTQDELGLFGLENILADYLKTLREETEYESKKLSELAKSCIDEYDNINNDDAFNDFREVAWPTPSIVYRNNKKCDFYYLTSNNVQPSKDDLKNVENEIAGDINKDVPENSYYDPSSSTDMTSLKYWLRYMCVATAIHCLMPGYWSTGLIVKGIPIMLPVIYIPACVIKTKRVILVIGFGVCGISISPMLLFCNVSGIKMSLLPVVNSKIESFIDSIKEMLNNPVKKISEYCEDAINSLDLQIKAEHKKIADINFQISEIGRMPKPTFGIYKLHLALGEDATFKRMYFSNDRFNSYDSISDFNENWSQSDIVTANDIDISSSIEKSIEEMSKIEFNLYSEEDKRYEQYQLQKSMETAPARSNGGGSSSNNNDYSSGDDEESMMNPNYVPTGKHYKLRAVKRGGGYGAGGYGPSVTTASGQTLIFDDKFKLFTRFARSWEGGFAFIPGDTGGPTWSGITWNTWCGWHKKHNVHNRYNTWQEFKDGGITDQEWINIIGGDFWNASNIDKIDDAYIAAICGRNRMHSGRAKTVLLLNTSYGDSKSMIKVSMSAINTINNMSHQEIVNLYRKLYNNYYYFLEHAKGGFAKYPGWKRMLEDGLSVYGRLGLNTAPIKYIKLGQV